MTFPPPSLATKATGVKCFDLQLGTRGVRLYEAATVSEGSVGALAPTFGGRQGTAAVLAATTPNTACATTTRNVLAMSRFSEQRRGNKKIYPSLEEKQRGATMPAGRRLRRPR